MPPPTITARTNKPEMIVLCLMCTALPLIFRRYLELKPINWQIFNPTRVNGIVWYCFFANAIFWWLKYFDNRPVLVIDVEGIKWRKYFWPFSKQYKLCRWNAIWYFYFFVTRRGEKRLTLKLKENEREIKIWVGGLNTTPEEITTVLDQYASQYGFYELGT